MFKYGPLVWFVIERNGKYAIRLKDAESPVLKVFILFIYLLLLLFFFNFFF